MNELQKIYIESSVYEETYTKRILSYLSHLPHEIVEDIRPIIETVKKSIDPISEGKRILVLEKNKGSFLLSY